MSTVMNDDEIFKLVEALKSGAPGEHIRAAMKLASYTSDRENVEARDRVSKAGAITPLVRILSDAKSRDALCAAGVIENLVRVLPSSGSEATYPGAVVELATVAMSLLLKDNPVAKDTTYDSLDGALEDGDGKASAARHAASALMALTFENTENRNALARANGLAVLVEAAERAAWALANCARDSPAHQEAIVEAGALRAFQPLLSAAAGGAPDNPEVAAVNACKK
eukprot:gene29407-36621_t